MIKSIVIVGGGTAGWITANHLAVALGGAGKSSVQITLLESPDIPTVGVGEGTVPAMRNTLAHFGIRETDFLRECDATFKQSIKFVDWVHNPGASVNNFYHHVFDYPAIYPLNTVPYWLLEPNNLKFADAVSLQGKVCDAGLAPKMITHPEFQGVTEYAYHLDAGKFSQLLANNAVNKLGVKHVKANLTDVDIDESGDIQFVKTDRAGDLKGDLFVDCSGFNALLIDKKYKVKFIDQSQHLFVDTALAMQVPYQNPDDPIASHTIATAKQSGWIWDIGLSSRRGVGYVYSSQYTDDTSAEETLRNYVGGAASELQCRKISMKIGYREKFWVNNCVSIGLSQGFVEPLEATGLLLFDAAAKMLAELLPGHKQDMAKTSRLFNQRSTYTWKRVIDFIKMHYYLSQRDDSEFWIDNRKASSAPQSLLEALDLWHNRPPSEYDFFSRFEAFNLDNYLYVLYGMEFQTNMSGIAGRYTQAEKSQEFYRRFSQQFDELKTQLEPNRKLLGRIKKYGLQTC
ncbi:tryptophan halogenase family protein [Aliikangiella coralliicola]|uniref:Tryptophan 7-halogenase n=1 Tax=Aliikangiella coralliicola TaxID=2592383 RepID=A0A545UHI5_9GAMM|nr:tryptophan halogenase family protein [Aliikangiella coralliicola]TQV88925.1 tryptophan 7-halogenase [Aliikangiella coralliicola]